MSLEKKEKEIKERPEQGVQGLYANNDQTSEVNPELKFSTFEVMTLLANTYKKINANKKILSIPHDLQQGFDLWKDDKQDIDSVPMKINQTFDIIYNYLIKRGIDPDDIKCFQRDSKYSKHIISQKTTNTYDNFAVYINTLIKFCSQCLAHKDTRVMLRSYTSLDSWQCLGGENSRLSDKIDKSYPDDLQNIYIEIYNNIQQKYLEKIKEKIGPGYHIHLLYLINFLLKIEPKEVLVKKDINFICPMSLLSNKVVWQCIQDLGSDFTAQYFKYKETKRQYLQDRLKNIILRYSQQGNILGYIFQHDICPNVRNNTQDKKIIMEIFGFDENDFTSGSLSKIRKQIILQHLEELFRGTPGKLPVINKALNLFNKIVGYKYNFNLNPQIEPKDNKSDILLAINSLADTKQSVRSKEIHSEFKEDLPDEFKEEDLCVYDSNNGYEALWVEGLFNKDGTVNLDVISNLVDKKLNQLFPNTIHPQALHNKNKLTDTEKKQIAGFNDLKVILRDYQSLKEFFYSSLSQDSSYLAEHTLNILSVLKQNYLGNNKNLFNRLVRDLIKGRVLNIRNLKRLDLPQIAYDILDDILESYYNNNLPNPNSIRIHNNTDNDIDHQEEKSSSRSGNLSWTDYMYVEGLKYNFNNFTFFDAYFASVLTQYADHLDETEVSNFYFHPNLYSILDHIKNHGKSKLTEDFIRKLFIFSIKCNDIELCKYIIENFQKISSLNKSEDLYNITEFEVTNLSPVFFAKDLDKVRCSALTEPFYLNNLTLLQYLATQGWSVSRLNELPEDFLLTIIIKAPIPTLKYLLYQTNFAITKKLFKEAIITAVKKGLVSRVDYLIKNLTKALQETIDINEIFTVVDNDDNTLLLTTLKNNLPDMAQYILQQNLGNIYQKGNNNNNLLHFAVQYGYEQIVNLYKNDDRLITDKNNDHLTPVILAAKYGKLDIFKMLYTGQYGECDIDDMLELSIKGNHKEIYTFLLDDLTPTSAELELKSDQSPNTVQHQYIKSIVKYALVYHNTDILIVLKDRYNIQNIDQYIDDIQALHEDELFLYNAIIDNKKLFFKFVLDNFKALNIKNEFDDGDNKKFLLTTAIENDREDIASLLIDKYDTNEDLSAFAKEAFNYQQSRVLEKICSHTNKNFTDFGIDINHIDQDGDNMLIKAAKIGNLDFVKYLLQFKNLDIDVKDRSGLSAFHIALNAANNDIAQLLLDRHRLAASADNELKSGSAIFIDNKALSIAFAIQNASMLRQLWHSEAFDQLEINKLDEGGNSPIMIAAKNGNLEFVKFLLTQKNVDLSIKNKNRDNILALSLRHSQSKIANFLLGEYEKSLQKKANESSIHRLDILNRSLIGDKDNSVISLAYRRRYFDICARISKLYNSNIEDLSCDLVVKNYIEDAVQNGNIKYIESCIKHESFNYDYMYKLIRRYDKDIFYGRLLNIQKDLLYKYHDVNLLFNLDESFHDSIVDEYISTAKLSVSQIKYIMAQAFLKGNYRLINSIPKLHSDIDFSDIENFFRRSLFNSYEEMPLNINFDDVNADLETNILKKKINTHQNLDGLKNDLSEYSQTLDVSDAERFIYNPDRHNILRYAEQNKIDLPRIFLISLFQNAKNLNDSQLCNLLLDSKRYKGHIEDGDLRDYIIQSTMQDAKSQPYSKREEAIKKYAARYNLDLSSINNFDYMISAAQNNDLKSLEEIYKNSSDKHKLLTDCNNDGMTALHMAAYSGSYDAIKFLLEQGSDLNIVDSGDNEGNHALIFATIAGHLDVVKILLNDPYFINKKNQLGHNAFVTAALYGRPTILKHLLPYANLQDFQIVFNRAFLTNNYDVLQILILDKKFKSLAMDETRKKSLFSRLFNHAVKLGKKDVTCYLIDNNYAVCNKETLHAALKNLDVKSIKFIMDKLGINIANVIDKDNQYYFNIDNDLGGYTLLVKAAIEGNYDFMLMLKESIGPQLFSEYFVDHFIIKLATLNNHAPLIDLFTSIPNYQYWPRDTGMQIVIAALQNQNHTILYKLLSSSFNIPYATEYNEKGVMSLLSVNLNMLKKMTKEDVKNILGNKKFVMHLFSSQDYIKLWDVFFSKYPVAAFQEVANYYQNNSSFAIDNKNYFGNFIKYLKSRPKLLKILLDKLPQDLLLTYRHHILDKIFTDANYYIYQNKLGNKFQTDGDILLGLITELGNKSNTETKNNQENKVNPRNLILELIKDPQNCDYQDSDGKTPLTLCAHYNMHQYITKILNFKVNINAVDQHGHTALYYAYNSNNGCPKSCYALLKVPNIAIENSIVSMCPVGMQTVKQDILNLIKLRSIINKAFPGEIFDVGFDKDKEVAILQIKEGKKPNFLCACHDGTNIGIKKNIIDAFSGRKGLQVTLPFNDIIRKGASSRLAERSSEATFIAS